MLKRAFLNLLLAAILLTPCLSAQAGPAAQNIDLLSVRNGNFEAPDEAWRYPPLYPENVAWWENWWIADLQGDQCQQNDQYMYACIPNGFYKEALPNGAAFIHSGSGSVTIRNNWDPWEAGAKQTINAPVGARVRLTAYAHLWASQVAWAGANTPSDTSVHAVCRVGLDPNGEAYPSAKSQVVWSSPVTPHDAWQPVSVEATVGPSGKVTVILYANYRGYSRNYMTASWDDATLMVAPSPALTIDYPDGQPGSIFTLTGAYFSPTSPVTVHVNFRPFTPTVPVDAAGNFTFLLNTAGADTGRYLVSAGANLSAQFTLTSAAPLRTPTSSGPTFVVPPGLGNRLKWTSLPLIVK